MTLDKMSPDQLEKAKKFYDDLDFKTLSAAGQIRARFNKRMILAEQRRRTIPLPAYA